MKRMQSKTRQPVLKKANIRDKAMGSKTMTMLGLPSTTLK
jgi:hypothetical protein